MATQFQPPVLVPLPYRKWVATSDAVPQLLETILRGQAKQVGGFITGSIQVTNPQIRKWRQTPDPITNLLLNTLNVPIPFNLKDFSPAIKAPYVSSADAVPNYLPIGIITVAAAPGGLTSNQVYFTRIGKPDDIPNILLNLLPPPTATPFSLSDFNFVKTRAFISDTNVQWPFYNLGPPTTVLGTATFASNFKTRINQPIDPPNMLPGLESAPITKPFLQSDWPPPFKRNLTGELLHHRPDIQFTASLPFNVYDWPSPFKPTFAWDTTPAPNVVIQLTQPITQPAVVDESLLVTFPLAPKVIDFPNVTALTLALPNPIPAPLAPQTQVFSTYINPVGQVVNQLALGFVLPSAPFSQLDWPSPFKTQVRSWDVPSNLSTFTFVNTKPFNQSDWPPPFPKGFVRDIPPANEALTLTFVAPTLPFALSDWPQTYRKPFTGAILDEPNILTTVTQPNPYPFSQADWPWAFGVTWNLRVDSLGIPTPLLPAPATPIPALPGSGFGREGGSVILQPKKQGETLAVVFDFISILAANESVISATVVATVYSGNDPSPQSLIVGSPAISGTQAIVTVTGGVVGTTYELLVTATTSLARLPEISAYYLVEPDLP